MHKKITTLTSVCILIVGAISCGGNLRHNNSISDSIAVDSIDYSEFADSTYGTITEEDVPKVNKVWNYTTEKDEMDDSKNTFASLQSENTVNLDMPYGATSAQIIVRKMKKYGTDVIIQVGQGQIFGSEYENDNYVMVRFDDKPALKFYFDEAADGSSEVVFLRKKSLFIDYAKKAKNIKVEVPFFQAGRQIFRFKTTQSLVW